MQSNFYTLVNNYKALREQNINVRLTYTLEYTQKQLAYELMMNKGDYSEITTRNVQSIIEAFTFLVKAKNNSDTPFLYCQLNIEVTVNNLTVFEDCVNMEDIPNTKDDIKKNGIIKELEESLNIHNDFIETNNQIKKLYQEYLIKLRIINIKIKTGMENLKC